MMAERHPWINALSSHRATRWLCIALATGLIWILAGIVAFGLIQKDQWEGVVEWVSALSVAWGIQQLMGYTWFAKRPWVADHALRAAIYPSRYSKSFPSDHAAIAFVCATIAFLWLPSIALTSVFIAVLISIARVLVGVHRPYDVIAGAAIGTVITLCIHRLSSLW